jgi:hypothetical protein
MSTDEDNKRLSVIEAAEYLGVSKDVVYDLCDVVDDKGQPKDPEISHFRFGRRIVIPLSNLKAYEAMCFVPAQSAAELPQLQAT